MMDVLLFLLKVGASLATAGSLLELGLQLEFRDAVVGLRNARFVVWTLLWGFALGPALAVLLTWVLPLPEPYAIGLIVMSVTPSAAYLALLVQRAGGDLRYSASFLLLSSFGIVLFAPLVLPVLVTGVSVTSWDVGKPLLILVLVPLVIGIAIRQASTRVASTFLPFVEKAARVGILLAFATTILLYAKGIVLSAGSFALASQVLFYAIVTAATYASTHGMPEGQRSVLSLGICSRNTGPAFATALSIPGLDGRAFVMVGLGILVQVSLSFLAARLLGGRAREHEVGVGA
jgi:bile acid:Na+ symporter, BASS family